MLSPRGLTYQAVRCPRGDDLFTFLRQPGLDATNWRAELAIRFGVILRKVWGGSRTWARAGAGRPDVGMADVLATGTFGPGLPESAPSRRACGPGPAPVIAARESAQLERPFRRRLSAETMRSPTTA